MRAKRLAPPPGSTKRIHNPAMRAALIQTDIAWEDWPASHAIASAHLKRAVEAGADLAILPEMFATGFSLNVAKTAQPEGGPTEQWLRSKARELAIHLIAGVAETGRPLPVNNALLVSPDGEVRRYSKIHPFSFAGEERFFGGGDRVVTWEIAGARVTPLVCYDLRFPEPFRLAADGTDALRRHRELARPPARPLADAPPRARHREPGLRPRRQPRRRRRRHPLRGGLGGDLPLGRDPRLGRRDRDRPRRRRRPERGRKLPRPLQRAEGPPAGELQALSRGQTTSTGIESDSAASGRQASSPHAR